jgi:RHS repeat-associated protein
LAFAPNYSPATNQFTSIPGVTVSYDANGNLLTDNLNTYTWDPYWGNMLTVNTGSAVVTATYDALGRMVENNAGGTYSEFVYGPTGVKLAKVSGTTLINAFVALPGGAKAIYNSSGALTYYRHSDWLGSSRLASTQSRGLYSSTSYAPFGEQYAVAGTADASFTGQDQDTVKSLYDFPARRQSPSQGRWISPDPAGIGAVIIASPQSWNRYAYVLNNPLALWSRVRAEPGAGWWLPEWEQQGQWLVRNRPLQFQVNPRRGLPILRANLGHERQPLWHNLRRRQRHGNRLRVVPEPRRRLG